MSDIKIHKMKLVKGGEKLNVAYEDMGDCPSDDDKTCRNPCHKDLIEATQALRVHLAVITEYIPEKNAFKNEDIDNFVVTGYSIGGNEESPGIIITGYRLTKKGKTVTLNTPFTRFEEDDNTRYTHMDDLMRKITVIEKEIIRYLKEGKKAEDPQGSLDFPEEPSLKAETQASGDKVVRMHVAPPANQEGGEQTPGQPLKATGTGGRGRKKAPQTPDNPSGS